MGLSEAIQIILIVAMGFAAVVLLAIPVIVREEEQCWWGWCLGLMGGGALIYFLIDRLIGMNILNITTFADETEKSGITVTLGCVGIIFSLYLVLIAFLIVWYCFKIVKLVGAVATVGLLGYVGYVFYTVYTEKYAGFEEVLVPDFGKLLDELLVDVPVVILVALGVLLLSWAYMIGVGLYLAFADLDLGSSSYSSSSSSSAMNCRKCAYYMTDVDLPHPVCTKLQVQFDRGSSYDGCQHYSPK